MRRIEYIQRINDIRKHVPGIVLSLMIVALLLCACGKDKAAKSGTPLAGQGVPALTVSARGADTPTAISEPANGAAAATPTLTPVQPTNTPTAAHTPTPTGTPRLRARLSLPARRLPRPRTYLRRQHPSQSSMSCAPGIRWLPSPRRTG